MLSFIDAAPWLKYDGYVASCQCGPLSPQAVRNPSARNFYLLAHTFNNQCGRVGLLQWLQPAPAAPVQRLAAVLEEVGAADPSGPPGGATSVPAQNGSQLSAKAAAARLRMGSPVDDSGIPPQPGLMMPPLMVKEGRLPSQGRGAPVVPPPAEVRANGPPSSLLRGSVEVGRNDVLGI